MRRGLGLVQEVDDSGPRTPAPTPEEECEEFGHDGLDRGVVTMGGVEGLRRRLVECQRCGDVEYFPA